MNKVRLSESLFGVFAHNAAKAVYLSDIFRRSFHYLVNGAEALAQELCRSRTDIAYSQSKNHSVKGSVL